jgi:predicted  nucleic acid-binding Zn-ribbon protein
LNTSTSQINKNKTMSDKKFDFVITGVATDANIHLVSQQLANALKLDAQYLELRLSEISCMDGADFTLIKNISLQNVKKLGAFLNKHQVYGTVRNSLQLEEMIEKMAYVCPACGHNQDIAPEGKENICQKCGVVGSRYQASQRKREIFDAEKRYQQADVRHDLDEAQKQREKSEEEALREEARRQLGIKSRKQKARPALVLTLLGVVTLAGYLYWQQNIQNMSPTEQLANDGLSNEMLSADQDSSGKPSQAGITIQAQGGNLTLNMPETAAPSSRPTSNTAENAMVNTVVTQEALPELSDAETQNLALDMYQQSSLGENPDVLSEESKAKATIMALAINDPMQRKAVLQLTGSKEWQPQHLIADKEKLAISFLDNTLLEQAETAFIKRFVPLNNMTPDSVNDYLATMPDSHVKARLLVRTIELHKQASKPYIDQLAKLTWMEPEAEKQVLIQGTLSEAYHLIGEKKLASLNLVMAIEKLRFIDSPLNQITILCELASYQVEASVFDIAKETIKLAEEKAFMLDGESKSLAFAEISKAYAMVRDFPQAINSLKHIDQPDLLKSTMASIDALQAH